MVRTCPVCRLVSPPEALRCDCGCDFAARRGGRASAPASGARGCLACLIGAFAGGLGGGGLAAIDGGGPHGYGLFFLVLTGMLMGALVGGILGYLAVKCSDVVCRRDH